MGVLGIVFAYTDHDNLKEITRSRTFASIPFGGRYRLIDFILSNYVNSNIHEVFVFSKKNYHALLDHLESGAEWDLTRKRGGLKVLTPLSPDRFKQSPQGNVKIADLDEHIVSIRKSDAEFVVLSGSSMIYKCNFREVIKSHKDRDADITVMYTKPFEGMYCNASEVVSFEFDENERVNAVKTNNSGKALTDENLAMKVYIIRKSLLEALVSEAMAYGRFDFELDLLQRLCGDLKIFGYEYKNYYIKINSITSYMNANLSLLNTDVRNKVFANSVFTKTRDSVPALYGDSCNVSNSIISDGCKIEGTVENSVLSRGVYIAKNAVVRNSVIMQDVKIMSNARIENAILDKEAVIGEDRMLSGHATYPVVIEKRSIV